MALEALIAKVSLLRVGVLYNIRTSFIRGWVVVVVV